MSLPDLPVMNPHEKQGLYDYAISPSLEIVPVCQHVVEIVAILYENSIVVSQIRIFEEQV